ncbi:MAG: aminomethyl-transferring glycine dehydrogenase subunit GcvPA [Planctomycetes bacterium]|nr:aminomethyl-transferring glycine dehydrogenase subunit GcvPA [Planctomycetota bacterium]
MDYTQTSEQDERSMLQAIGADSIEDLFAPIPKEQRFDGELNIPAGCSEMELLTELQELAAKNKDTTQLTCFLGCGAYDHFVPTIIDHLAMRGEFLTAYTPYQAEASQGVLQAFYEFQTMICQLTGMEIANASLYDGASAAAEAAMMAFATTRRTKIVLANTCHPDTVETLETYANQQQFQVQPAMSPDGTPNVSSLANALDENTAAVLIQFPDFFGQVSDLGPLIDAAHDAGALAIVSFDPLAAGIFKRPGDFGADIVIGEGQPLGIPLQYGAPYLGFFAAREKFLRKMPGRVVGVAHDAQGNRGYCLVLQTREQHIKREKATSNVCTNQGLMAMRATVYMSAVGRNGLQKIASLCYDKTHYAADRIAKLPDYALKFDGPFFKEFVVQTKRDVSKVLDVCHGRGILAGVPLNRWYEDMADCFTIAVTECRTRKEIDALVEALATA